MIYLFVVIRVRMAAIVLSDQILLIKDDLHYLLSAQCRYLTSLGMYSV